MVFFYGDSANGQLHCKQLFPELCKFICQAKFLWPLRLFSSEVLLFQWDFLDEIRIDHLRDQFGAIFDKISTLQSYFEELQRTDFGDDTKVSYLWTRCKEAREASLKDKSNLNLKGCMFLFLACKLFKLPRRMWIWQQVSDSIGYYANPDYESQT